MRLLDKQLLSSWKKKKNIKEGKEGLGSIRNQTQKEIHKRIKAKVLLDTTCIYLKKMEHRQMCVYIYIYIYIYTHTHIYIYKYKYMWSMRDTAVSHNNCSAQFNHSVVCDSLVTPWIAAHQSSLSITNSWRSLWLMSIESVMPFSHLILCCPLLLLSPIPPSITVFSSESTLELTGVSALAPFLPKKSQGWSPLGWTGWISLQSKELSRVFSNTTVQKHQFFGTQLSSQFNSHIYTWPLEKQ